MDDPLKNRTRKDLYFCAAALLAGVLVMAGCAQELPKIYGARATSPSAAVPWIPPPEVVSKPPPAGSSTTLAKDMLKPGRSLALSDIVENALRALCQGMQERFRIAITLSYGPRYLHSTGQYHKGGPNKGLFVQVTAGHNADLAVP